MLTPSQRAGISTRAQKFVEVLSRSFPSRNGQNADGLLGAADFIERELRVLDIEPIAQEYCTHGLTVRNLIVEMPGITPSKPCIIVGAHYDTVLGTPGADDNATGVAGLIELARLLKDYPNRRTIRLVAFPHEEPPYFYTSQMGSRRYARSLRQSGTGVLLMLALEMIGYAGESLKQLYPFPLMRQLGRYPKNGSFIALVSNLRTAPLLQQVKKAMRDGCSIEVHTLAAPGNIPPLFLSDHSSFWKERYPAIMVTDTAFLRNPHYHQMSDTSETLNYEFLADVVSGLHAAIVALDKS